MADGTVAVTAGVGTSLKTWDDAGGVKVQYVRELQADTNAAPAAWTATTTGSASVVAADAARIGVLLVNTASGRVYLRFDSTIPTTSTFNWYLESGDRWEVPKEWCRMAISMLGATNATGNVLISLGTDA